MHNGCSVVCALLKFVLPLLSLFPLYSQYISLVFITAIYTSSAEKDSSPQSLYAIMSFSYVGAMLASNHALQFVSYPTQVTNFIRVNEMEYGCSIVRVLTARPVVWRLWVRASLLRWSLCVLVLNSQLLSSMWGCTSSCLKDPEGKRKVSIGERGSTPTSCM